MNQQLYSVIIPVYKSEKFVAETVRQTLDAFQQFELNCEIVLVNDGSPDNSWQAISDLAEQYEQVVAINLLKNYGQHTAVFCGMKYATGDYLITIDDDLQNPPLEIIKLIHKIQEGYDLVFAKFYQKKHSLYRRLGSKVIGYLNKKVFHKPDDITLTNFRIFSRAVAERTLQHRTYYPYIQGLLLMYASKVTNTMTEHHPRIEGTSNYSLLNIAKLTARLLFNYSSYPLQFLTFLGFGIALLSFGIGTFYLVKALLFGSMVQGWTTLAVLLSFFNGFIIIMLGVLGEYVTRMMSQMSSESAYHVKEVVD